jgi:hypothetical protein
MTEMSDEQDWVPQVHAHFSTRYNKVKINCIAMEHISELFGDAVFSDISELMRTGWAMLRAIETLHKRYQLSKSNATPFRWGFTESNRRLVLVHITGSDATDVIGYERTRDLHRVVFSLVYKLDNRDIYLDQRTLPTDIEDICRNEICPPAFRELVEYVLSMSPDYGTFRSRMYEDMRGLLYRLID